MIPATIDRWIELEEVIRDRFDDLGRSDIKRRMIGLLVGSSESKIMKDCFVSRINELDLRSSDKFDLYILGWRWHTYYGREVQGIPDPMSEKRRIDFDEHAFTSSISVLERFTTWSYHGETDLILLDAVHEHGRVYLDLGYAVALHLTERVRDDTIRSVNSLIEEIIEASTRSASNVSTQNFVKTRIRNTGAAAIASTFLNLDTKGFQRLVKNSIYFKPRDIASQDGRALRLTHFNTGTGMIP